MSIIQASELHQLLTTNPSQNLNCSYAENLLILFVTKEGSGPGIKPPLVINTPKCYLPNAINFDLEGCFSDHDSTISNTMISAGEFCRQAALLGIGSDSDIIIYDDYGNFYASRVWFMFKTMGHKKVRVLDGGLHKWLHSNFPTQNKPSARHSAFNRGQYITNPQTNYKFVDQSFVLEAIEHNEYQIIDARSFNRFAGHEPETRGGLRSGHIPSSASIHYARVQNEYGQFLSKSQLQECFKDFINKKLIFTCGSGVTACILAQAADSIGFTSLNVYDGSWSEWGANNALPINSL